MHIIKFLVFALFISFLSSTLIAQVENSAKGKNVKAEKQIEKVSKDVKSAKDMAEAVPTDMKKACGPDCKMECCSTETKEMKAEMKKGEKMLKQAQDCDCEGCKTASTAIHKDHNMMKKSHVAACDCEGCKVAHAEMKENKAHSKDCTCKGCAKT